VERVTGEKLLSDQTIWEIVKGKAETYSQQIRQTVQESLESSISEQIQIKKSVEIYNVEESEILLFDDGIQVKGQKSERNSRHESTGLSGKV
jgi:predicted NAD/FAD-binding protein